MIDWDRVAELRQEVGAEDFDEVVTLFLEEVQEVADRLTRTPDLARLEADLHFVKGSAYNLGFERLGALCTAGERLAAAGRATEVDVGAILDCHVLSRETFLGGMRNLATG